MTEYKPSIKPEDVPKYLAAMDPFIWAKLNKVKLVGGEFRVKGFEPQSAYMRSQAKKKCVRKATQTGFTEAEVLCTLHGLINRTIPRGALYLFPTGDEVTDFSDTRFKPLISENACIGKFVRDSDRVNLKRVGGGFLYFRGARMQEGDEGGAGKVKKSAKLKSVPADKVVFDEFDEMPFEARALAVARMEASDLKAESYLANPTLPDWGVDFMYETESDRRVWMWRCLDCGKETCMDLEFPSCLRRGAGLYSSQGGVIDSENALKVFRVCVLCGKPMTFSGKNGRWVARTPDREMEGYWVGRPSMWRSDAKSLLEKWENPRTDKQNFHNLDLGVGYVATENKLTETDVFACCGKDVEHSAHDGPCAMGIDVGKNLNMVIGCRPNNYSLKVLKSAELTNLNDAADLAKRFNVRCAVIDLYPETRKVREFQRSVNFEVFLCEYRENQRKAAAFDQDSGMVHINRTEILDATHDLVTKGGRLELPRRSREIELYAKGMCATAKVLEENKKTGEKYYTYKKLGADHFRHATNYFLLASQRIGVARPVKWVKKVIDRYADPEDNSPNSGGWMAT